MNTLNLSVPLADSKVILTLVVPQITAAVSTSQSNSRVDTMTCAQEKDLVLTNLPNMNLNWKVGTMNSAPTNAVKRSASWCATTCIPHLSFAYPTNPNLACPALKILKSVSPIKSVWLTLYSSIHILPLSIPERIAVEEALGSIQITLSVAPGQNTMRTQINSLRTAMSCLLGCPKIWSLISSRMVTLRRTLLQSGSSPPTSALNSLSFQKYSEEDIT